MTSTLEAVESQIKAGELDEARHTLESAHPAEEERARHAFLRGRLKEESNDFEGALAGYEEAMEIDPDQNDACFRAALIADQRGDSEAAIELYQRCIEDERAPVAVLINLALLLEEANRLPEAEDCLQAVLNEYPNHKKAELFLKSVMSSYTMVYDEDTQREHENRHQVLDKPIAEFELSVRSRNCLRQMDIHTLGDLLRTTEAELLSYKNFGETSLNEVKALLQQTDLKLGQSLVPAEPVVATPAVPMPVDPSAAMNLPVTDLELSVRSRKCLQWLGVRTLGELVTRSEVELMAIKNFGQTSLSEIKRQLARFGLSFRQSD